MHNLAAEKLKLNSRGETPKPTDLHRNLLRLYKESASPRIVTTNFDLLFEQAAKGFFDTEPKVFTAPALPLGREFNGIFHVHGSLGQPTEMVLTDKDFGRAYLTEGWARRFLVGLFHSFPVLFVGCRHNDTVMNHLARALPVDQTEQRFVLTDDADDSKWKVLGIEPILYPKLPDDNYTGLYEGIQGLADYARRGILEWQHRIAEIARKPPNLDEEEMGLIEEGLAEEAKARFFTDAARSPEWIDWLDKREHLNCLFGTGDLRESQNQLGQWLAQNFARDQADKLFLLIGRHSMRLCPNFWFQLGGTIASRDGPPLEADTLSRWISLLLSTSPPPHTIQHLLWSLGKACITYNLMDWLVEIFDALTASRLMLKPSFARPDTNQDHPRSPSCQSAIASSIRSIN